MTIDELLQEHRIHRQKVAAADIEAVIVRAETDIESAQFMLDRDPAWRSPSPTTESCRLHAR